MIIVYIYSRSEFVYDFMLMVMSVRERAEKHSLC